MKLEVFQIDAWRNPDGTWWYNNSMKISTVEVSGHPSVRKILRAAREKEFISNDSIYSVDESLAFDGIWTIMRKNTLEPLFDFKEIEE